MDTWRLGRIDGPGDRFGRYPARSMADNDEIVDHFTLPAESWWTHYQTPLEAKFPALRAKYADDEAALAVVEEAAEEHRICREYPGTYGYEFYIARATD